MFRIFTLGLVVCVMANSASLKEKEPKMPVVDTSISVVSQNHVAELGEGPYYVESEKALYYVDATKGEYCRVDTETGQVARRPMGPILVSIIIPFQNEPGQFIVSRRHELLKLNWATGALTSIAFVSPDLGGRERFNDAKCDAQGRFFIGTVLEEANGGVIPNGGALYRLDGNELTKVAQGFSITNGMAWSNDGSSTFYLNDSEGQKIYVFDYNLANGTLSNQRVLIDVLEHEDFVDTEYPDGMAIDRYGYIWVAMWNGGRIVKINPETASVVDQVVTPRNKIPTSLAFGDYKGQFGFYLTTAAIGIPENQRQDDGKVLHININGGKVGGFIP